MKKFIITYHAPAEAMHRNEDVTPEQAAEGMKQWQEWADKLGSSLTDLGLPLDHSIKLGVDGKTAPSSRDVRGYSIIEASSMEEALSMMDGHPHLSGWHQACEIEIHEALPML